MLKNRFASRGNSSVNGRKLTAQASGIHGRVGIGRFDRYASAYDASTSTHTHTHVLKPEVHTCIGDKTPMCFQSCSACQMTPAEPSSIRRRHTAPDAHTRSHTHTRARVRHTGPGKRPTFSAILLLLICPGVCPSRASQIALPLYPSSSSSSGIFPLFAFASFLKRRLRFDPVAW